MKEVTKILTLRITDTKKGNDAAYIIEAKDIADGLKKLMNVDDVQVMQDQLFEFDKEGDPDGK